MGTGVIVLYYFSCAFIWGGEEVEFIVSKLIMGVTLLGFLLYSINDTWKNVKYINSVLQS